MEQPELVMKFLTVLGAPLKSCMYRFVPGWSSKTKYQKYVRNSQCFEYFWRMFVTICLILRVTVPKTVLSCTFGGQVLPNPWLIWRLIRPCRIAAAQGLPRTYSILEEDNVQQLTRNIDLSCLFYSLFFSFLLIELKLFVLKRKVQGDKFCKRVKKSEKSWGRKRWKTNDEEMVDFWCRFFHGLHRVFHGL